MAKYPYPKWKSNAPLLLRIEMMFINEVSSNSIPKSWKTINLSKIINTPLTGKNNGIGPAQIDHLCPGYIVARKVLFHISKLNNKKPGLLRLKSNKYSDAKKASIQISDKCKKIVLLQGLAYGSKKAWIAIYTLHYTDGSKKNISLECPGVSWPNNINKFEEFCSNNIITDSWCSFTQAETKLSRGLTVFDTKKNRSDPYVYFYHHG